MKQLGELFQPERHEEALSVLSEPMLRPDAEEQKQKLQNEARAERCGRCKPFFSLSAWINSDPAGLGLDKSLHFTEGGHHEVAL